MVSILLMGRVIPDWESTQHTWAPKRDLCDQSEMCKCIEKTESCVTDITMSSALAIHTHTSTYVSTATYLIKTFWSTMDCTYVVVP